MEGNKMEMRETLVKILDAIKSLSQTHNDDLPEDVCAILGRMAFEANAALSAPARNCDRYKDAPSAYADFIVPWKLDGHLDDVPTLQDFTNWLFAPAEEQKGEGDGR